MDELPNIVILETRVAFLILPQRLERQLQWILHTVCSLGPIKCLRLNWSFGRAAILYQRLHTGGDLQVTICSTSLTT